MATTPTQTHNIPAFLAGSPITPTVSGLREERLSSPCPQPTSNPELTNTPSTSTLKPLPRGGQLATPPFSPLKNLGLPIPEDELYKLIKPVGNEYIMVETFAPLDAETPKPASQEPVCIEVVQGRGIKRKYIETGDENDSTDLLKLRVLQHQRVNTAGWTPTEWFTLKFVKHADTKRFLETEKAKLARMKPFRPRPVLASVPMNITSSTRSHKRNASGQMKRTATVGTPRSSRQRVEFQTSTRATATPIPSTPKPPKPRAAPKAVDPSASPRISKGQRSDADFEEALLSTSNQIYYPPSDNLERLSANAMKVEWKGTKKIYSEAERLRFRSLRNVNLHPKEIELAGTLHMVHLAQYEESKRLIFDFWFRKRSAGEKFTKTHAQQVARIDVNKASSLWTAFEKVGWFSDQAFEAVKKRLASASV